MKKNLYIGGYSILDLADKNVYAQALICAKQNKPVLVYDDPLKYFADTIAISGDDVVITKGGKTITINDANAVSSVGGIQNHLYRHNCQILIKSSNETPLGIDQSGQDYVNSDNVIVNFTYISNSETPITKYNEYEQLQMSGNIYDGNLRGVCKLSPTNEPGDTGYYDVNGVVYNVNDATKFVIFNFSFDDLSSNDLTITDEVTQLF